MSRRDDFLLGLADGIAFVYRAAATAVCMAMLLLAIRGCDASPALESEEPAMRVKAHLSGFDEIRGHLKGAPDDTSGWYVVWDDSAKYRPGPSARIVEDR